MDIIAMDFIFYEYILIDNSMADINTIVFKRLASQYLFKKYWCQERFKKKELLRWIWLKKYTKT